MNAVVPVHAAAALSPLVLADRLISLAQDADRAGFSDAATHLVSLVYNVLDRTGGIRH